MLVEKLFQGRHFGVPGREVKREEDHLAISYVNER